MKSISIVLLVPQIGEITNAFWVTFLQVARIFNRFVLSMANTKTSIAIVLVLLLSITSVQSSLFSRIGQKLIANDRSNSGDLCLECTLVITVVGS
jgi:hypothetical protein